MIAEQSVQDRVKEIIVAQLGVNPDLVTLDAKFIEDLGSNAFATEELVRVFEKEFGEDIPKKDVDTLQTVGDVIKYIEYWQGVTAREMMVA